MYNLSVFSFNCDISDWKDIVYSMEKDFYITLLNWFEVLTQSVWNVWIKFDTWNNIEICTVP